ncbi:MFS transporter [Streptomyces sp. AC495_CC817]|uniref:MFS transporter n=1 Tax=Streptomyces sp. AC495_CC817 TaxID=2823900 RepID=UPI001C2669B1|nr:MFS transporter [Streptomyces sp. AC495_CC817]
MRGLRSALASRFSAAALARSFSSLRDPAFRWWSAAQFVSGSGGAASMVGIAWLVVELGGDGLALGVVTGAVMLPTLLAGPYAGLFVDRFSRRAVLLCTQAAQAAVAATLAVLAFGQLVSLPGLLGLSLAQGVAFAIDNPARQLLVLDLVGRERTTSAVSMNEVIINSSRIVGPAVAGAVLVTGGAGWCFVVNAVSFAPGILVLLLLRIPVAEHAAAAVEPLAVRAPEPPHAQSPWRFAATTPRIRTTLALAIGAAASYNIAVVMPLMASDVFGAGGEGYAAIAVAFGLGALPGALLSATGPVVPRSEEVRALAVALALAVLLVSAAPVFPVLLASTALAGGASMWFIARANALVLLETPPAMRGRVMGIWAMMLPGSSVVTGLLVGGLADATDPRVAYGAVGLVIALTVVAGWRSLRTPVS